MLKIYVVLCCVMLNAFCDDDTISETIERKKEAFKKEKDFGELFRVRSTSCRPYLTLESEYETVKKNIKILLDNSCIRGHHIHQSIFSLRTAYYSMHKKLQLACDKVLRDEEDLMRELDEREASVARLNKSLRKQAVICKSLDRNSKEYDDAVRKFRRLYRKFNICKRYIESDKVQHVHLRDRLKKYTSLQKELQACVRQLETLRVVLNVVERENLFVVSGYGTWNLHLLIFFQTWGKIEEQYF